MSEYTPDHARSGIEAELPKLEVWPNTNLPDFGTITLRYVPDRVCLELKAFKGYILGYRSLGIFYENAVNRILRDVVEACQPVRALVRGEFNVRGGMKSIIEARHPQGG